MKARLQRWTGALLLAALTPLAPLSAHAADVTLRFHQFLPPQANVPKLAVDPWIHKVQKESGDRLRIQHFASMQLGGKPPELFDQAKDGVVDLAWVVLGFTPGRFPKTEPFELPFLTGDAEAGSRAFQEYVTRHALDEFKDVKLIAVHVHGPGVFHSKAPITKLEDLKGMRVRGGSRTVNVLLEQLGATPVGMPVTSIGESLSKGVIDATTIPFEVVPSLKVQQIVRHHTNFSGANGLYTLTFAVVMNKAKYDALPADLKKVIDANSGPDTAALFGRAMKQGDVTGRAAIEKAGNTIHTMDTEETRRWQRAANGVKAWWYADVGKRGIDGPKLAEEAEALIARHAKSAR